MSKMLGRFRSSADRLASYEIKTDPERVKKTNEDMRKQALEHHSAKQMALSQFELKAKEAIDPTGVPSALYVSYLNYCREVWKKANTYGGAVLVNETEAIIAKWKARHLDEAILRRLRKDLFAIAE